MRSWGLMVGTYMPLVLAASNTVGSLMLGHNLVPRVSLLPVPWTRSLPQSHSQGLSSLPPLVVGTETLVATGHVTTQNLDGRVFYCHSDKFTKVNVLDYPPTLWFWMDRWSRDQPQRGSLFQRLKEAEKRDPGNEVGSLFRSSGGEEETLETRLDRSK